MGYYATLLSHADTSFTFDIMFRLLVGREMQSRTQLSLSLDSFM